MHLSNNLLCLYLIYGKVFTLHWHTHYCYMSENFDFQAWNQSSDIDGSWILLKVLLYCSHLQTLQEQNIYKSLITASLSCICIICFTRKILIEFCTHVFKLQLLKIFSLSYLMLESAIFLCFGYVLDHNEGLN